MTYPSESFEKYIVPSLFGPWARKLIQLADPRPGERVLDVACGTGIVARQVARSTGARGFVVGLDFNPNMIRVARAAAAADGLTIEFRQGRAEAMPFPSASFNLVTCQFGLMLFDDPRAALREMRRVLRPGGRVVLSTWQAMERHPFYKLLHEVRTRRLGISGVEQVYSLADPDELQRMMTGAGLQEVEVHPASLTARFAEPQEFLTWELTVDQASIPSMRDLDAEAWQAVMQSIRDELQAPLQARVEDGKLILDFHANLARGSKAAA